MIARWIAGWVAIGVCGPAVSLSAQESESLQKPMLQYLAWHLPKDQQRDLSNLQFWTPDGESIGEFPKGPLLASARWYDFQFNLQPRVKRLTPLVFVFSLDTRANPVSVIPTIEFSNGVRVKAFSWKHGRGEGFATAAVGPRGDEMTAWPKEANLSIRYSIENPQVIKTISDPPFADVEISEGISCAIRENPRMGKYLETCFRLKTGDWEQHKYQIKVYLTGEESPVDGHSTLFSVTTNDRYELTAPFDPESFDRIEVTRQRFADADLGSIKIRNELLKQK